MSFAYDVKQELAQRTGKSDCLRAQGYGLFLCARIFSREAVRFQSENEFAAQVAADCLRALEIPAEVEELPSPVSPDALLRRIDLTGQNAAALLDAFGCQAALPVNERIFPDAKTLSFFLGGAFLACGNITDPEKSYHMELAVSDPELADALAELVSGVSDCRRSTRKGQQTVYLKESEQIADLLTFLGATRASLSLMETKIVKDVRNKANRQVNCDTANLTKTASAAVRQYEDICLIRLRDGLDSLPEDLRALAKARLELPDATLRELGEALDPPISRSGVAHRFARLAEIAAAGTVSRP